MKKKVVLLGLVLVLCLGGVGIGSAMWSDVLTIDGTVNTGTVAVEWSLEGTDCSDTKGASSVTANIVDKNLVVTITNAYPCIYYYVYFDIHNSGSIPVHLGPWLSSGTVPPEAVTIDDLSGLQLHPCEAAWGILVIHFDNYMGIEQGTQYTLVLSNEAVQWNEAPA